MREKKKQKRKDMKVFSLKGKAIFKGFVKNGLDSSVLINLIVCFDSEFNEFRKRGFTFPPNLFYFHEISHPEVVGVLINSFGFTKKEAKEALRKLIKEFNLEEIIRNENIDKTYEEAVKEANLRVVYQEKNKNLLIGEQDIIIIGGFLRNKINLIHTGDRGFKKTCGELGLNVIPLPKEDIDLERKFRKRS
jgi:hypothetical protein